MVVNHRHLNFETSENWKNTYEGRARMRRCDVGGGQVRILCHAFANNLIGTYLTIRILETLFATEERFPC